MLPEHKIRHWQCAGALFFRFDCAPQGLALKKIFHEGVFIGAIEDSVWVSKQGGKTYTETPETLILRDEGRVFSVHTAKVADKGGVVRGLLMQDGALKNLYRAHTGRALPCFDFSSPIVENKQLRDSFVAMHRGIEKESGNPQAENHIMEFVKNLAGHMDAHPASPPPAKKCLARDIIDYIRAHYRKNIMMDDFARLTACNSFVLMRQFRNEIGCTPHDYLHMYRIARAKEHIARGIALSEVADLCGFADQSHLTRCFKRLVGVTPGQFLPLGC